MTTTTTLITPRFTTRLGAACAALVVTFTVLSGVLAEARPSAAAATQLATPLSAAITLASR